VTGKAAPQPDRRHPRAETVGLALVGTAILAYVVVRARNLPLTFDEVVTWQQFAHGSWAEALGLSGRLTANDHLLNTAMMKLFLPGDERSELLLRLPNVLAGALYLGAAAVIARRLASPLLTISGFLILSLNPFVLDYFSLARGYGLACGFLLAAVVALHAALAGPVRRKRLEVCAATLGAAAVLANLTFVLPYAALLAALVLAWAAGRRLNLAAAILGLATIAGAALFGERLDRLHSLFYGGHRGFFADTVVSLARATIHRPESSDSPVALVAGAAVGLFLASGAFLALRARSAGLRSRAGAGLCVAGIAAGASLLSFLPPAVLGTPWLEYRTAIFLLPLAAATVVLALDEAARASSRPLRWTGRIGCLLLACLAAIHMGFAANGTTCWTWPRGWDVRSALEDLAQIRRSSPGSGAVRLGVNYEVRPSVEFYRSLAGGAIAKIERWEACADCDMAFIASTEIDTNEAMRFEPARAYPQSDMLLGYARPRADGPPGPNELENPGFETREASGAVAGWQAFGHPLVRADRGRAHRGAVAVEADATDGFYQAVPVRPGVLYLVSHFTRADGPGQFARLQVNWLGTDRNMISSRIEVEPTGPNWEFHRMFATAPPGAAAALVHASVHEQSSVWFDDFFFGPAEGRPPGP
jgi:hypothetical protein